MSSTTAGTSTFHLPDSNPSIPITHPSSLTKDQLLTFPAFKLWLGTLQKSLSLQYTSQAHPFHFSPYALRSVAIQSVDFFLGDRLGFLKLKATVTNDAGEHLPGAVFMRGGSVTMLIILSPESTHRWTDTREEYVILTIQPRIAAGSLSFVELPAGMIDDSGTFAGAAAKEIREETGLEIAADELLDLTQLTMQARISPSEWVPDPAHHTATGSDVKSSDVDEPHLQAAIYPSPGGSDEFIPIFLARKTVPQASIDELKGKLTGLRGHGEKITLKIVRLDEVWKVAGRDGKTLAALALYQGLKGEGRI
ncbi:uncharacterized protein Z518_01337 [Rhinocladiella mackenziei CBS 650.93]|uniref:Rhinocladiella mackenziei CBS 650.93 unplaced genomic scaffold supercont1.1, whole genome shotgun sequence n=1 Tax=Rhinocladiella mackenziei CBS 650.93 TaxID=1442369 RepID=A0A0D2J3F8_9EURO|nr:uncharacterized protein Z518_01337 [Rhinocladiella mackenziei CBS 650.93]KIX10256.1 hypothetical protein Z518_01337 [Rhinocladiella mackenziei CBS 650.93]